MAKNKNSTTWENVRKKIKDLKMEMILINAATIILGILMVAIPDSINGLICQTLGVLLCLWGIIRIISYFRMRADEIFGSFGMVQGCAMLGFGIFFLANPNFFVQIIDMALAIILLVTAIVKIQYAFDYMKLNSSHWWIHLIGAVVMLAVGILALTRPFGIANIIMVFIGCGLIFSGVWDLISVIYMSNMVKKTVKGVQKKIKEQDKYVDVEAEDDEE